MKRRACLLALPALLGLPLLATASPAELPQWLLQGQAQMRYFGLLIYDVRLWSPTKVGAQDWTTQDLALELQYARSLSGKEIAKRSLAEMGRQGEIQAAKAKTWLAEMEAAFPDVKAGDRITGRFEPGAAAQFFVNGQRSRRVADAEFARLFFGIWLSAQSSEPKLRQQLLQSDGR